MTLFILCFLELGIFAETEGNVNSLEANNVSVLITVLADHQLIVLSF